MSHSERAPQGGATPSAPLMPAWLRLVVRLALGTLGLAIAAGIVRAHKGKIWAESPGYDESTLPGSTFFIHIPLAK